jgi:hypothetical protein
VAAFFWYSGSSDQEILSQFSAYRLVRHAPFSQIQCLGDFFGKAGHVRHDETGRDCPDFSILQFYLPSRYAGFGGGSLVVQFVSLFEDLGKEFGMSAMLFVNPRSKLLPIGDDGSIFLLSDE